MEKLSSREVVRESSMAIEAKAPEEDRHMGVFMARIHRYIE